MRFVYQAQPSRRRRVEELKRLISSGHYRPDARVIAEAILQSHELSRELERARSRDRASLHPAS